MATISHQLGLIPLANPLTLALRESTAADARLWSLPPQETLVIRPSAMSIAFPRDEFVPIATDKGPVFIPIHGDSRSAPLSLWQKIKRFVRKQTVEKIVANMKEVLEAPEDSKTKIADAVMIGAVTPYVPIPIPGVGPFLASASAKIFKRNPAIAVFATLYNNVLTMGPILYAQHELGRTILPATGLPTFPVLGMDVDPAAFAVGTIIMAAGTALVARYGTILTYDRVEEPLRRFMTRVVEKYEATYGPLPYHKLLFDSLLTHGGKWIIWGNVRFDHEHGD